MAGAGKPVPKWMQDKIDRERRAEEARHADKEEQEKVRFIPSLNLIDSLTFLQSTDPETQQRRLSLDCGDLGCAAQASWIDQIIAEETPKWKRDLAAKQQQKAAAATVPVPVTTQAPAKSAPTNAKPQVRLF